MPKSQILTAVLMKSLIRDAMLCRLVHTGIRRRFGGTTLAYTVRQLQVYRHNIPEDSILN